MMVIGPMRMRRGQSLLDADRELIHPHLDAVLRTALEIGAMDLRVLVLVLDLVAALGDVLVDALVVQIFGQLPRVAAPADGEVACRVRAGGTSCTCRPGTRRRATPSCCSRTRSGCSCRPRRVRASP